MHHPAYITFLINIVSVPLCPITALTYTTCSPNSRLKFDCQIVTTPIDYTLYPVYNQIRRGRGNIPAGGAPEVRGPGRRAQRSGSLF